MGVGVEAFSTRRYSKLPYQVLQPHQKHGDEVRIVYDRQTSRDDLQGVDALITQLVDFPIGVRSADCVPILLYDPVNKVIAAIHSGWRGTVLKIVDKALSIACEVFGTKPNDVKAVIGPSIGPESFCVHGDVIDAFEAALFPISEICTRKDDGTFYVNLWEANKCILKEAGVTEKNIQLLGICSYIHHDEIFSARYEKNNKCGRTINVIKLVSTK